MNGLHKDFDRTIDRTQEKDAFDDFLFHASHRGEKASCVLRSVAETCRQWERSFRDYIYGYFIGQLSGRTDYENMMPWSMV